MKLTRRYLIRYRWLFIALPVIVGLGILAIFLADRLGGVNVRATVPVDGGLISARGKIEIEFDRPMNHDSVQSAFRIEPSQPGLMNWDGNKLVFTPQLPFQSGASYHVRILQGAQAANGTVLKKAFTMVLTGRSPEIAYLSLTQNGERGDIWRIPLAGGQPLQLTRSGGKVREFAVSRDGEYLVYSVDNSQSGDDLWVIDRDGGGGRRLVDCGEELCMQAAWSMDGGRIAYSRSNQAVNGNSSAPARVWLVDVASSQTAPLYQDAAIQGTNPSWSPDGRQLAEFDANAHSIRILDLETNTEVLLPTGLGQDGGWSPDGRQMIYNDIQSVVGLPTVLVYRADLTNNQIIPILGQDLQGEDYGVAEWSPDGAWIVIGVGNTSGVGGKQIEIMKPDGSGQIKVTDDLTYAYASYHWDPSGKSLVFQGLQISRASSGPEIEIWQAGTAENQILVKNAALPEWIP
jgi:Tol biopolymer transport system component